MSSVQAAERLAALPLFVAQQPDIENPCGFPFVGSTQASARVYHAGVGSADQPSVSWNTRFSARSHSSAEGTTGSCPAEAWPRLRQAPARTVDGCGHLQNLDFAGSQADDLRRSSSSEAATASSARRIAWSE